MAETVLNQQEPKLDSPTDNKNQNIYLKRVLGIILSLVMIALTAYVLHLQHQNYNILSESTSIAMTANDLATNNYRTYVGRYKETKVELDETTAKLEVVNKQLDQVTAQLAATKGMLADTQGMLSAAQEENTKLKQELLGLDNLRTTENVQDINQLQARITSLKDRDSQITSQLSDLKSELRAFDAQIASPQEGRSLITLFQDKIKLVKTRMQYLRQEAFYAKIAAQKEKDRLALLNGNSGFVMKDGKLQNPNGTKRSYAIDVKIMP